MQYQLSLKAGVTSRQQTAGTYFVLQDIGAAASVALRLVQNSQELENIAVAHRGVQARCPAGEFFTSVELTSPVDTVVQIIISNGAVSVDTSDGANVNATITGATGTLAVSNDRGSPGSPLYVSGSFPTTGPAAGHNLPGAVAVDAAGEVLIAANVNRVRAVFTNTGTTNPVAVGPAGLTWASRAIVLQPGDTWVEDRAANLAWSAICAAGTTTTVGVHEVTA